MESWVQWKCFVHTFKTWESSVTSITLRTVHSSLTLYTWNDTEPLILPSLSNIAFYKYEVWHSETHKNSMQHYVKLEFILNLTRETRNTLWSHLTLWSIITRQSRLTLQSTAVLNDLLSFLKALFLFQKTKP